MKKKFQIIPEINLKDGTIIKKHVRQINKDQTDQAKKQASR